MDTSIWVLGLMIGLLGGCFLALVSVFSRVGPLILPVYVVIIAALKYVLSAADRPTFVDRIGTSALALLISTSMLFAAVLISSRRERARLPRPLAPSPPSGWKLVLVGLALILTIVLMALV